MFLETFVFIAQFRAHAELLGIPRCLIILNTCQNSAVITLPFRSILQLLMGIAFYVRCQEGRHLRNHFSFSWEITSESKIFLLSELSFAASPSETLLN